MKTWICKSRIIAGNPCKYECTVQTEFEPRGCLYQGVYEEWQEVKDLNQCPHKSVSCWGRLATCLDCGHEWIKDRE